MSEDHIIRWGELTLKSGVTSGDAETVDAVFDLVAKATQGRLTRSETWLITNAIADYLDQHARTAPEMGEAT